MPLTYENLATTTLTSNQSTVTFSSIPSNYTDLVIVAFARSNYTTDSTEAIYLRFNSDSGSNYSYARMFGNGSTASSLRTLNASSAEISTMASSSSSYTGFSSILINVMNYSNTTTNKTVLARGGEARTDTCSYVAVWRSTAAINTILLAPVRGGAQFVTDSVFTLYGIKAA